MLETAIELPTISLFYVSVMKGYTTHKNVYESHARLLIGPFDEEYQALKWVDVARTEAYRLDTSACWYVYGTAKLEHCPLDGPAPVGIFNHLRDKGLPQYRPATLDNRRIPIGQERRLRLDPSRPGHELNPVVARTWRVIGRPLLYGHCVMIEPVGSDGFKCEPRMLAIRYWEEGEEIER